MLRKYLYFALFFLLSACAERDIMDPGEGSGNSTGQIVTELSGNVEGELPVGATYTITGNLIVPDGKTLIIREGVKLLFENDLRLTVNGILNAMGTKERPVKLLPKDTNWKGLHIVGSNNSNNLSELDFCIIEGVVSISDNPAEYGAIEVNNGQANISNCIIRNNRMYYGGGFGIVNSEVTLRNNLVHDNTAIVFGGGMVGIESNTTVINNTFYNNYCENSGGAIYYLTALNTEIQNNIFHKNTSYSQGNTQVFFSNDSGSVFMQYNFIYDGSNDPVFASDKDFHLGPGSPAKNQGNPGPAFNNADGTRNDLGAYGGPGGDW